MEPGDAKMVHEDQTKAVAAATRDTQFMADYHRLAKAILKPAEAKGKGKGKGKKAAPSEVTRTPVDSTIPHHQVSARLPPGAHIWQNRKGQAWSWHVPPRPRFSEPWGLDTTAALFRISKRAWEQHLQMHGLEWSSCPHIFP